jgi:hypothetical protein
VEGVEAVSGHTPGRWVVDHSDSLTLVLAEDNDPRSSGGPWNIAQVYFGAGHDEDPQEANARLIAAAPDLLEALRAVVKDRAYQKLTGPPHFTSAPTESEWKRESAERAWAMVEAAIAKAVGR